MSAQVVTRGTVLAFYRRFGFRTFIGFARRGNDVGPFARRINPIAFNERVGSRASVALVTASSSLIA
jgi:hypothetical protein